MKKHNGKVSDLGFGHLGNGIIVWDKTREKNNDYIKVAHISADRVVEYYASLSDEQKNEIERYAREEHPNISATQSAKVFNTKPTN